MIIVMFLDTKQNLSQTQAYQIKQHEKLKLGNLWIRLLLIMFITKPVKVVKSK
jgi:hypothetical protein